jgi:hypothetical protein
MGFINMVLENFFGFMEEQVELIFSEEKEAQNSKFRTGKVEVGIMAYGIRPCFRSPSIRKILYGNFIKNPHTKN